MLDYQVTWRAARVNAGYTLKDVSEKLKKSIDTIQRYEKDSSDIPLDLMNTLLDLYNTPTTIIFFGKESDLIGKIQRNSA